MKKSIFIAVAYFAFISSTEQLFAQDAALKTRTKSNQTNEKSTGNVPAADDWQQQNTKVAQGQHIKEAKLVCRVVPTETGCTIEIAGITAGVVAGRNGKTAPSSSSFFSVSASDNSVTEVKSPMDAASGLPTGKRMTKSTSVSSTTSSSDAITSSGTGGGAGKATFKEFTVTKRCGGKTTKISCDNGDCEIPTGDCPNGDCSLTADWSWGMSQSGSSSRCSVDFLLEIQDGVCHAINTKGTGGTRMGK